MIEATEERFARGGRVGPGKAQLRRAAPGPRLRRDLTEDFADSGAGGSSESSNRRQRTGLRLRFSGGLPESRWGRVGLVAGLLAVLGGVAVVGQMAQRALLRDERFVIPSSAAIAVEGNRNVTRAQTLGVFAGDVDRNIFRVPLEQRRAELEQMPWVKRATVMRLLPDHLRVLVTERTPVAFVREGGHIALVDSEGVLLEMGSNPDGDARYSFPVVTGIRAEDPVSTRRARMRIAEEFTSDLDSAGERISTKLSEVDVSNPEDVKALIPEGGADVLVHFGDADYLKRYRAFAEHLPEWRTQYPKLWSVDMRYERQVVLEMQPGTAVPLAGAGPATEASVPEKAKAVAGTGKGHAPAPKLAALGRPSGVKPLALAKTASVTKPEVLGVRPVAKKGPELVGHWDRDGTYHAPGTGEKR